MVRSILRALLSIGIVAFACNPKPSTPRAAGSHVPTQPAPAQSARPAPLASTPPREASVASDASPPDASPPDASPPDAPANTPGAGASPPNPSTSPTPRAEIRFSNHYPPDQSVQLLSWKKEHRASGPSFDQRCWELPMLVGTPPAQGLLCTAENRKPEFTLARIYRLEGSALREVWSATIATYANWLELTPIVAPDGLSLELHDGRPWRCRGAIAEYRAKRSARVPPPSGELLEPACSKVGTYLYQGGAFRLQAPAPRKPPTPFEY